MSVVIRPGSWFFFAGNRSFGWWMLLALLMLATQMYLNTGNLSAYAVTLENPFVREGYIVNYDYAHDECNYHFIMGDPVEQWAWGWVLRRVLFFIISYPFFQLFGFYNGGILSAFLMTFLAFYGFTRFMYVRIGPRAAYASMALLATYPGIMYWIGSPFSQVMIVPCCCWLYMILWHMERTEQMAKHLVYLLLASLLFTAYDLAPFFYPVILLLYLRRRQWKPMFCSFPIVVAPQLLIHYWLCARGATELHSENSGLYLGILKSYLHPGDPATWCRLIMESPWAFIQTFFSSNFFFLPLLFVVALFIGSRQRIGLDAIERGILLTGLLIFLFNNLAPPYELGTSLRGAWIARIYQPIFVVMIIYTARLWEQSMLGTSRYVRLLRVAIAICVCANLAVNVGSVFGSPLTEQVWYRFYQHAEPGTMRRNIGRFGVRLWGFPGPVAQPSQGS